MSAIATMPLAPVYGSRSAMPDAPVGKLPPPPSAFWNGFMVVVNYLFEVVTKVAIPIILGVLAHFFLPALAPACFVAAIAVAVTRLVVKILDQYDIECLDKLKHKVSTFMTTYWWLQIVAFICALAISLLSPIAGSILAGATGVVAGFLIGIEKTKHDQQRSRDDVNTIKAPHVQIGIV